MPNIHVLTPEQIALLGGDPASAGGNWGLVNVPQWLPPGPHNLPPRRDRPLYSPFEGLTPGDGGSSGPGIGAVSFTAFDPHHYARLIQGVVAIGVASVQVLPESPTRRNWLSIRNSSAGAQILFVSFGTPATVDAWLRLDGNQIALFDAVVPQDDVYVISDIAGGQVSFAFSTVAYPS